MTPPGLTCARCHQRLYPAIVRATDDGWMHTGQCPRACAVDACDSKHHANGYCQEHNRRLQAYGDPMHVGPRSFDPADRLEDVRWMAETGEHLEGAAGRLGLKVNALEKWLERHDRECLARLIARTPRDHNRRMERVSISELTGRTETNRRRKERAA